MKSGFVGFFNCGFLAKRVLAVLACFLIILIIGGIAGLTDVFAASNQSSEEVRAIVADDQSVRLRWPEYGGSGYSYVIQMKEDEAPFETVYVSSRNTTEY